MVFCGVDSQQFKVECLEIGKQLALKAVGVEIAATVEVAAEIETTSE